ncbi:MAG TPA: ABC transporter permease [Bryobacteraceae bacterium]|nr:ABC transporter permease [Bryobacteraceae bacterium]
MSELRYAFRAFFRQPGFTLAAAIVLALGMGATTAIYTLIRNVLLDPLPYPASNRMVWIWNSPPRSGAGLSGLLGADFLEIRDRSRSFERVAGLLARLWIFNGEGDSAAVTGARVSEQFFETLGVQPIAGRAFLPAEYSTGRDSEVIFSDRFWRRRFGGDPGVVGRHIVLDGAPYDVVGIMPPDLPIEEEFEILAPLPMDQPYAAGRLYRTVRTLARLKDGVTIAQANAGLQSIAADLGSRYANDRGYSFQMVSFLDQEVGAVRSSLWILAAAVACVLLIACSNVASLLLARGAVRLREMAVRAAVGATRAALIRQLLIESTLVAIIGGAMGYPLAVLGVRLLLALDPRALPRAQSIHVDAGVLAFAFLASLATGIICGIVPAIRGSRVSLSEALKEGGRSGSAGRPGNRFRAALVVIEVALGVMLMAGAGLLARSFRALTEVEPGYKIENVLTMELGLSAARYQDTNLCRRFFERLIDRVQALSGVQAAGITNLLPLNAYKNTAGIWLDTQPVRTSETMIRLDNRVVSPEYFRAMGVPLIAGRFLAPTDREDTPIVMVVNEAFAREFFPRGDALGHRIIMGDRNPVTGEIVGIVGSFRESSIAEPPRREVFTAYSQTPVRGGTLVIRSAADPAALASAIRATLASIDQDVSAYNVRTMRQQVDDSLSQPRLRGALLAVFSMVALLLASLGVYGVISCAAVERKQEIGIRVALGARIGQVRGMIVGEGLRLTAIGLALGLIGAAAATRLMQGLLFGVTAADPITYAATAAIFIAVAFAASYVPARRATRLDPLRVLREE